MDQDKAPCPPPPPPPLPLHVVRNHPPSSDAPADGWRPSLTVFGCGGGFSGLSQVFGFRTPVGIFWADAVMSLAVTQCRWVTEGGREVLGMNPADSTIFLWPL